MHEEHNFSIHSHCSQDPSDPRVSKVPGGGHHVLTVVRAQCWTSQESW